MLIWIFIFNYISALLSTYSKEKERIKEEISEENSLFPKEMADTIPDYEFNKLDLFIMYKYIEYKKLYFY